ncbi:hypothetical protein GH714_012493 [Hevea brasiliensis]|uniref:Uncharacterized protein n=1 Tax=Hevea brasiliensis TaxID=3981 RepID=A0A6A6MMS2_HEVBR|nr:hypothetical protein GH714_012493 [Hevea brasiliensis]
MEEVEVPILIIPVAVNNLCKLFLVPMMCRLGPVLLTGIRVPPPGICDILRFHLDGPDYKMILPVEPRVKIPLSQTIYVDYIDRTAYRAMAFEYLDFSPVHPFIPGIRAWISLLFMEDGNEGVIDVFGIEMDFRDAANSREEVLWLLDMLDWK